MQWLIIVLPALAGLVNPVQSAANAGLNRELGQPVLTGLIIYAVGMLGLLACAPFLGLSFKNAADANWSGMPAWVWVGGLANATFVLAASIATPQLGAATVTVLTSCLALVASIAMDHYGLMGLEPHPANLMRILGGVLAIAGIVLVSRF